MDMDEMEISYDSEDEQYDSRNKEKFKFLANKTSKFKRKFNIDPFVLIEHLLSDYLLISHNKNTYSTFLTSLYMARKLFGIGDQIIKYTTCLTCCKLYSVNKLPTDKPSHCSFQNFPNHPMANYRSSCGAVITKQVPTNQGIIYRPALIFPIVNIKRQLQRLYNKKGFKESCRKWAARPNNDHELSDIYDRRI